MATDNRPLSPHLQVYKFQLTMFVSVLQRITGGALALGLLVFTYWLGSAAYGPEAYAQAQTVLSSWIGYLLIFGFSFALNFHVCNGIRHLCWDIGWGYEKPQVKASTNAVVAGAVVLTALTWIIGLAV